MKSFSGFCLSFLDYSQNFDYVDFLFFFFLVQIKERLFPASFRKQHLAAQEASHAAATAGRATQRGGAPSNRESTEHALVHQPIQEAGDCQCTGGSSNSPVAASDGSICLQ